MGDKNDGIAELADQRPKITVAGLATIKCSVCGVAITPFVKAPDFNTTHLTCRNKNCEIGKTNQS